MSPENLFRQILHAHADAPPADRRRAVTAAVGEVIPFVGTAGLRIETYTPTRVVAQLANRRAVQNHIGGLHAAAMTLLVETVAGLVVALNVPDESVPVLRTLSVDFRRRAEAPLRAEATLSDDDVQRIRAQPLGKIDVPVTATDAADRAPVRCTLQWAWLPRDRAFR